MEDDQIRNTAFEMHMSSRWKRLDIITKYSMGCETMKTSIVNSLFLDERVIYDIKTSNNIQYYHNHLVNISHLSDIALPDQPSVGYIIHILRIGRESTLLDSFHS